ncbi:MAG: sodium/proline symporter [Lachnospiraceae bacterium]|nr:sodium/proline symporter [Lachnospiraceae bacterium]
MTGSVIVILATIAAYLISVLLIGFKFAQVSGDSTSDFYLGGRSLGPFVTAMSAEASDMSSYLLMGLPGLAYLSGLADVGWTVIGLAVGTYLNWLLTARRLRRYTEITGSYTIPQFFSKRFHDEKNILSTIAAVVIILFFIPYTASGFAACGKLFHSLFGIDYTVAMVASAVVIVAYTAAGGFLAASTTDFIQSIIMTIAIFFVLIYSTIQAGGVSAVLENARSLPGYFALDASYMADTRSSVPYGPLTVISTLAWGLGYFGMPHILLRFMAIEDAHKLKISRRVASVWAFVAMMVAVGIGVVGRALTAADKVKELSGSESETIIVRIADILSKHGILPAVMAGLILAGILASTMSTSDSQLLAASSSVTTDILQEACHLKLSRKASIVAARVCVILIAVLGIFLARDPQSSVFGIVSFAWAGFGAGFGPVVICSLYWKRTTLQGAVAGMISGGAMIFVWKYLVKPLGGIWGIYELLPAFMVSLCFIILGSLLTPKPSEEIEEEFDRAKGKRPLA